MINDAQEYRTKVQVGSSQQISEKSHHSWTFCDKLTSQPFKLDNNNLNAALKMTIQFFLVKC